MSSSTGRGTWAPRLVVVTVAALVAGVLSETASAGTASRSARSDPENYHPHPTSVSEPFDCGINNKVPFPNPKGCVWVTTKKYWYATHTPGPIRVRAYCPRPHDPAAVQVFNFPFQVLLGNDPLWKDLSQRGSSAAIRPVSFTKDKHNGDFLWSWAGQRFDRFPHRDQLAGYVSVVMTLYPNSRTSPAQIQYVCTNRFTSSADP
jgi:hypothetical protein